MRLSILDQSPIISGHTPQQAIQQTIRLAQAAEKLGHRYWLAEHHAIAALAYLRAVSAALKLTR